MVAHTCRDCGWTGTSADVDIDFTSAYDGNGEWADEYWYWVCPICQRWHNIDDREGIC